MCSRGRAFAAAALVLMLAQLAAVCAVPLVACAASPSVHRAQVECCPAGTHPPGECPLHKQDAHSTQCRMTCARQGATPFVPGVAAVLLPSPTIAVFTGAAALVSDFVPVAASRGITPSSPPPKSAA